MVRSMTGFAQAQGEEAGCALRVTVKALNHRFLDLHLRLSPDLEACEPRLRALVRERVLRGHLDVQILVEKLGRQPLEVDQDMVRNYVELFRQLQQEYQVSGDPDLTALLRLPGALRSGPVRLETESAERLAALAGGLLGEALDRLDEMRRAEGTALERELRVRLERIREGKTELVRLAELALPAYHRRLGERLQELLGQSTLDPTRLAEEAAYLAERSDISEELTRLESHAEQFARLLASDGSVGKRLDFLLQEMNREINTVLSKAPGLAAEGLEMTRWGLEVKAQIERLREQVQNVE